MFDTVTLTYNKLTHQGFIWKIYIFCKKCNCYTKRYICLPQSGSSSYGGGFTADSTASSLGVGLKAPGGQHGTCGGRGKRPWTAAAPDSQEEQPLPAMDLAELEQPPAWGGQGAAPVHTS